MSKDPDRLARTPLPRSEMSFGRGMYPNPRINYDDRNGHPASQLNAVSGPTQDEQLRDLIAYRRLDSTRTGGETLERMYYASGNVDRFGPNPPLVNVWDKKQPRDRGPRTKDPIMKRAD